MAVVAMAGACDVCSAVRPASLSLLHACPHTHARPPDLQVLGGTLRRRACASRRRCS
jgi:hypothetical protein